MQQQLSELLRPTELADLIQPLEIIQGLERMVRDGSLLNMLFYGKPGIGKTSAARVLLKKLEADVYEINGSMLSGVGNVREDVRTFCASLSLSGNIKVCLIEECEHLSVPAQAALRNLIEKAGHVRFLMTANDIRRIDPALKSRCRPTSFDIGPLDAEKTIERLLPRYTARLERLGYNIDQCWLSEQMHVVFPDLRKLANAIEFKYGVPNEEHAASFQIDQHGEVGSGAGEKAA